MSGRAADKKRFRKVIYDGSSCIVRLKDEASIVDDLKRENEGASEMPQSRGLRIEDVWLTEREFEDLPDFQGW